MNYNLDVNTNKLTISEPGLQDIVINLNEDAMRFWCSTSEYQILTAAGGHWEVNGGGGLPALTGGFEVTPDGHLLVHQV